MRAVKWKSKPRTGVDWRRWRAAGWRNYRVDWKYALSLQCRSPIRSPQATWKKKTISAVVFTRTLPIPNTIIMKPVYKILKKPMSGRTRKTIFSLFHLPILTVQTCIRSQRGRSRRGSWTEVWRHNPYERRRYPPVYRPSTRAMAGWRSESPPARHHVAKIRNWAYLGAVSYPSIS